MGAEKKIKKSSVFILMLFTLGSRILGLIREILRADYLGATLLNDAFNVAFTIPNLLRRLFAESSMSVAFIPTFKGYLKNDNKKETDDFLNSIFTALTFLVSFTVLIGILVTPLLLKVLNKNNTNIPEVELLTRIMFPYLAFISIAALFQALLNSLNKFGPGSFVPILFNIIIILSTIFLSKFTRNPARAIAIGVTIGGFAQMSFQLPYILKSGFGFRIVSLKKAFSNSGTKKVGKLIAPTLLSMGAYQLSIAIAPVIAVNTGVGISSALTFSLRLQELVLGIFAVSIGTILISTLSKDAKDKNWARFRNSLELSINAISLITIPVTLYAFIHSKEIVTLIYMNGEFGIDAVNMTAGVFRVHILGLFSIALTRILAPAFFSLENSKTPSILGVISVVIGIISMFVLAPVFKANGIASSTVITSMLLMILYYIYLTKQQHINFGEIIPGTIFTFIRVSIHNIIPAIVVLKFKDFFFGKLDTGNKILDIGLPLIITTLIYFSIYIISMLIFREKSIINLKSVAKKR